MKHMLRFFVVMLYPCLALSAAVHAQQQRDPKALAVAEIIARIPGWNTGVPLDTIASVAVTRSVGGKTTASELVAKVRDLKTYRLEFARPNGDLVTTITNGHSTITLGPNGKVVRRPVQAALTMLGPLFPFLTVADRALLHPSTAVSYLGTRQIGTDLCDGVEISASVPKDAFYGIRRRSGPIRVWLSQRTGLPAAIGYLRLADSNAQVAFSIERTFSDYRLVNNVMVPFTQQEQHGDSQVVTYEIKSISFNSGIPDSDFDLSRFQEASRAH